MKIIPIHSCENGCPYLRKEPECYSKAIGEISSHRCGDLDRSLDDGISSIPEWCELDDAS